MALIPTPKDFFLSFTPHCKTVSCMNMDPPLLYGLRSWVFTFHWRCIFDVHAF